MNAIRCVVRFVFTVDTMCEQIDGARVPTRGIDVLPLGVSPLRCLRTNVRPARACRPNTPRAFPVAAQSAVLSKRHHVPCAAARRRDANTSRYASS